MYKKLPGCAAAFITKNLRRLRKAELLYRLCVFFDDRRALSAHGHVGRNLLGKALNLSFTPGNPDDLLLKAKWHFLCGQSSEASKCLDILFKKHGDSPVFSEDRTKLLARLGQLLDSGFADLPPEGEIDVLDCDYSMGWDKTPLFLITSRCPCCDLIFDFGPETNFICHEQSKGKFLCPACLSILAWNKDSVRDRIWDIFENTKFQKTFSVANPKVELIIMLARALLPLARIRFGACPPFIGHGVMEPARFYNAKKHRLYPPSLDFFCYDSVSDINRVVTHKWDGAFLAAKFDKDMRFKLHSGAHRIAAKLSYDSPNYIQHEGFEISHADNFGIPWEFSEAEVGRAAKRLREMGIPDGGKVACLLVRDGTYDKIVVNRRSYLAPYRNADIDSYKACAEFLAGEGYYVLRMGHVMGKPISWHGNCGGGGIIDYAFGFRDPFMDVYLFSHCDLCVTTASGIDMLSQMYHRPTVFTNYFYETHCNPAYGPSVMINKHFHLEKEKREISLEEYLDDRYKLTTTVNNGNTPTSTPLEDVGIRVVDNSPEEILDAVAECLEMMNGRDSSTAEDKARQDHVWAMTANRMRAWRHPLARYGRLYLRNTPLKPGGGLGKI